MTLNLDAFLAQSGLSSLLGANKGDAAQLAAQAQNIWKMLDEMHEKEPQQYRAFISKQKQDVIDETRARAERKGHIMQPKNGYALETRAQGYNTKGVSTVFLNICQHESVPIVQSADGKPIKDTSDLEKLVIPMSVGPLRPNTYRDASCHVSDIVIHPSTLERSLRDLPFQMFLLELSLHHLERECDIVMHRPVCKMENVTYVGKEGKPVPQLTEKGIAERKKQMEQKKNSAAAAAAVGPKADIVLPSTSKPVEEEPQFELKTRVESAKPLIQELDGDDTALTSTSITIAASKHEPASIPSTSTSASSLSKSVPTSTSTSTSPFPSTSTSASAAAALPLSSISTHPPPSLSSEPAPSIILPSQISASSSSSSSSKPLILEELDITPPKITPEYSIRSQSGVLHLTVTLPTVQSVSDVDVDISSQRVVLSSKQHALDVRLPSVIDDSTAAAKWNKKKAILTITATIQD